jgi:hypothetical protein
VRTALNPFLRYVVNISLEFDCYLSFVFISDGQVNLLGTQACFCAVRVTNSWRI